MATKCQKIPGLFLVVSQLFQALQLFVAAGRGPSDGILTRDVCIVGGGSSGTYAAIRLQQLGMSVALIEKEDRLGGHVNTYVDPITNVTFDYGVITFDNIPVVTNYFAHFDLPLVRWAPPLDILTDAVMANFQTGSAVSFPNVSLAEFALDLEAYQSQLAQYPYLTTGWQDLPSTLPDDFFLPWGEYIQKYQYEDLGWVVSVFLQGVGNILAQSTLYIYKYLNIPLGQNLVDAGFLSTAHHNNQALYNKALAELGSNAFVSSNISRITRSADGVNVTISTPSGTRQIAASKLLVAIQPELSALTPFDLDDQESQVFGQFNHSYYWNALIGNSGIPEATTIVNVNPENPYQIPTMPDMYIIQSSNHSNLHTIYYNSPHYLPDDVVQADILATISRLNENLGHRSPNGTPEFLGFNSHAPFELTVSNDAIKNGFYQNLTALQGRRSTWWTGATWQGTHDSSVIWNYTEHEILPQLTG
ncbi:MAG: hypothetical protein M1822_003545 [Bathelium mastoideum]|nr:MAG: hypothetical protein M1822_003545 [Bathelium mastoideum]